MPLTKNFDEMFVLPEEKSVEWDDKFFTLGKQGNVKEVDKYIETANEFYMQDYNIRSTIGEFTKKTTSIFFKRKKLKNLRTLYQDIKDVKIYKSAVVIKTSNYEVKAAKLTDIIRDFKEDKDIETNNRQGKCHEKSLEISQRLGIPNDVVTGFVYGLSDKSKYLHSWVEFKTNSNEYVIDYTYNVMMNKDGYYGLNHAEPLSRISNENIKQDLDKYIFKLAELNDINMKEYFLYRDEIISDLLKNKSLFEEER